MGTPPAVPSADRPSATAMRRALRRARDGVTLSPAEAEVLLAATGLDDAGENAADLTGDLADLCASAARVRDAGLLAVGRPGVVTYSRKVFIPLIRLCRDRCHYCTFVTTPNRLARDGHAAYLSPDEVLDIARRGAELGCKEALFTLGDRPEDRWPEARAWLDEAGYDSTLGYVRAMAVRVLEETGLLPHLNPGVLSWEDLQRLKPVAPSMGMMLETTSREVYDHGAHAGSPDKDPTVRLRVLEDAGRSAVPFTTGILVGIGETTADRAESLFALRTVARRYGGVQEVIIQNFRAKPGTAMRGADDAGLEEYLATVAVARLLLGPSMRLQAPPNLVDLAECRLLLAAGVDDWGGVSPLTPDHVNPERPWPDVDALAEVSASVGFTLRERLTVHPPYQGSPWLDPRLRPHVDALAGPDGLAADGAIPAGLPWQEPDGGWASSGRTDLHTEIDVEGRRTETRSDVGTAYGDWSSLEVSDAARTRGSAAPARPVRHDVRPAFAAALRSAEARGNRMTDGEALTLLEAEPGAEIDALAALADDVRHERAGDDVTYVVNRNINFTNVCYTGCRFCAFAQRASDADAYTLSLTDVGDRVDEAWAVGATEVCMQGGISPDLPASIYTDLAREVKRRAPGIHLHAFSPMEVVSGAARTGLPVREFLLSLREAGVDTIPGTAAEILDDDVRWLLTKGKLPASTWVEVVTAAHEVGLHSSSTMMYGHVDVPEHWVGHLRLLRAMQERTGGFTEFVLLPFVHQSAPIYLAGLARPGPTPTENRAIHAVARLLLAGAIDNIQCSWVKLGLDGCADVLRGGVNDIGGTLMEETISRMAGSQHGSRKSVADLEALAAAAGREVRQRGTTYGPVSDERVRTQRDAARQEAEREHHALPLVVGAAPGSR